MSNSRHLEVDSWHMLSKTQCHFRSIAIVRHPRIDVAGITQHLIQRGVDRSVHVYMLWTDWMNSSMIQGLGRRYVQYFNS